MLLFDVYLTWARIEKATPSSPSLPLSPPPPLPPFPSSSSDHSLSNQNGTELAQSGTLPSSFLAKQPILLQYLFFLLLCTLETLSFHLPIRTFVSMNFPRPLSSIIPHYPRPALISTALLVSSFTKLFPLMLLVWNYDLPSSASAVSWAVIINNVAALEILLDCGYIRAALLAGVGAICRAGIGWVSMAKYTRISNTDLPPGHTARSGSRRWSSCSWSRRDRRPHRSVAQTHGDDRAWVDMYFHSAATVFKCISG